MGLPTARSAILLASLLAACRDGAPAPPVAQPPGAEPGAHAPTPAPEPAPEPASAAAASTRGVACEVARVVDGDTLNCADGTRVRLIGMDTPELAQAPFGREAQRALVRLAPPGSTVHLERDVTARDRYGRTLAWVWAGDTLVNEALVRRGFAVLYTIPPNVKYAGRIERAQKAARGASAGLWARNGFDCLPKDARQRRC